VVNILRRIGGIITTCRRRRASHAALCTLYALLLLELPPPHTRRTGFTLCAFPIASGKHMAKA